MWSVYCVVVAFHTSLRSDSDAGTSHLVRACNHHLLLHIFSKYHRSLPIMPPTFSLYWHLHKYLDSNHCNKEDRMFSDRYIQPNPVPRYRESCFLDTFIIWHLRHKTLQTWRALVNLLAKNNMVDAQTWKTRTKMTHLGS
jgi:hypothetical protein